MGQQDHTEGNPARIRIRMQMEKLLSTGTLAARKLHPPRTGTISAEDGLPNKWIL